MPGRHGRSRSRSRRRDRERRSSRSRNYSSTPSLPQDHGSRGSERSQSRVDVNLSQTLNAIMSRLNALENNRDDLAVASRSQGQENSVREGHSSQVVCGPVVPNNVTPSVSDIPVMSNVPTESSVRENESVVTGCDSILDTSQAQPPRENIAPTSIQMLADAITKLNPSRCQKYFVSNFDPNVHDMDVWCAEVERAKLANGWDDYECLSRVASCLRGDARVWVNEWVSDDRSWTNFKQAFKALCPRKLDYAGILYEVMTTSSDKYPTFAEYARRSLLRLRIVKGLSEELMIHIIIRGITDAQIKATAANANLTPENIVSFLCTYNKPNHSRPDSRPSNNSMSRKRPFPHQNNRPSVKCLNCGRDGHTKAQCFKKLRTNNDRSEPVSVPNVQRKLCEFCKKPGHLESNCFAKERSGSRNERNVNLCADYTVNNVSKCNDVTTAIVEGIPVDVLIDSGAINISLISSDIVKHFSCQPKPTHCVIKGVSDKVIEADSYVTLTIEFSEITIEADFVVVPASCMNFPIVVGTDILNRDGVTYVRTKDAQYLTRSVQIPAKINTAVVADKPQVNTSLQGAELDALMKVIDDYSDFLISGTASTTVKTGSMRIEVTSETPVAYRPYRLSHQEKLKVREIIADLLDKGIVRESRSEYSSPILLVKKKDGSDRMCVDYRALNRVTVKDRYPMPLIDDHIDRLGGFRYFTSLDMATGFHQIPIDEASIRRTAFVTPEGHYEYLKMPYGLTNSPIVYQRIINDTLRPFINSGNVVVYVDDVLIMSNTVNEGLELLRQVLKTLTEAGFSINLKKCSFLDTEVEYLGRVVSAGQVRPSPRKVEALVNAPVPTNVRQVRQFLGLAGYFRRYIQGYSTLTACIAKLTKQGVPFAWGPEQERVRQELITKLTSEPILTIFDPKLATEVHTDASSNGYGAVLLQIRPDGRKQVVAYFSKVTQGAERRYHSYELETLAVVKALQHFRHYLIGLQFKVVTDCNALKSTERKKDLLPRVARWWVYLQDFTFDIEYRKGSMMSHADFLSRNPTNEVNNITKPRNWAQIAQAADDETRGLIEQVQDGRLDPRRYVVQNDLLYYRYAPVGEEARLLCFIPKGHRLSLLRIFHDEHEHIGAEKTTDLITKHFWFPGLRQFVAKYIAHCLVCMSQKRVPRASHQTITSWEKPEAPFSTVHIDALGPLPQSNGYKFILLLVDAFTKLCLLYPIYRQDAEELQRVMSNAISLFGVPKLLVTDRGRMFESAAFVNWVTALGSDIHYITPEMHQANGQVERYVRTVLNMLRVEVNHRNARWSELLWKLQLVLNITRQKTTQTSALNLLIGTEGTTPIIRALVRDVALEGSRPNREAVRELHRTRASELLRRNQSQQDAYVNKQRVPPRMFQIGDLVFVIKFSQSTGKLDPGMRGPYKVTKALQSGRYELKLLAGSYGKTTQAAAEYMVPWRGEWCPETCAAFFECECR